MEFFKKQEKVKKPDVAKMGNNPYLNGREEWLERYGSYIERAKNWRIMALGILFITFISITGNVIQASSAKVIPYIVEVDKLGRASTVARVDSTGLVPERLIQSVIGTCISDWRTVTADLELQRKMIERLSFFFAGSAKGVLKEWFNTNNPYDVAKDGKLVHIELKSLPLPIASDSYRIEWTETVRSHAGVTLSTQKYEATVTIQINPPTSEVILMHNPGGVYITSIAASKVFDQKN